MAKTFSRIGSSSVNKLDSTKLMSRLYGGVLHYVYFNSSQMSSQCFLLSVVRVGIGTLDYQRVICLVIVAFSSAYDIVVSSLG